MSGGMIDLGRVQGHWQRDWIRAPGLEDGTTRVHWLQAGALFADIRVPLHRPLPGPARCLAEMPPAALADLLSAEGFAGTISLQGDVCTWHRRVNWRGFPCPVDAGRLWFDADGALIEDGVHADYREQWQRRATGALVARQLHGAGGMEGVLVTGPALFLLVLGSPEAPARPDLAASLRAGLTSAADAAPAFDSVCIMGRLDAGRGVATLSTQPFCEGRAVLAMGQDAATLTLPGFDGSPRRHDLTLLSPVPAEPLSA